MKVSATYECMATVVLEGKRMRKLEICLID